MPGLSKVIVLDPDVRACRQIQLGFEREGVPTATASLDLGPAGTLELPGDDAGLVVVGGVDGQSLDLVRRVRRLLDDRQLDAPIVFAGRGVARDDARAAGADEVVLRPAFLRDVVTIGRLLRGLPARRRSHLAGNLVEITGVYTLVRAFTALGRSATLTLIRGLRRGEIRFYHGEVTSAQVGMIHGQAALHQLLLWTDARFDFHHEDVVRRQQIPMSHDELFADAERFLEGVRDSSGGLSPSVVLEPNLPRVQSLGKQIPTEVYGVLRMFDGHRMLADVLEDSAYRVFETLRVAQRAVDAGLLRVVDRQPPRATWRAVLAIEHWLVGSEVRDTVVDAQPIAPVTDVVARPLRPAVERDGRDKNSRKRRKKRRRVDTPVVAPRPAASVAEIDWGALVPRTVGAEVGPLAGVVPAAHVSGEIVMATPSFARQHQATQPKVVFDEAAEIARDAADAPAGVAQVEVAAVADADPRTTPAAGADAHAEAIRAVAATVSLSGEPPAVSDDSLLHDTKPERLPRRGPITMPGMAVAEAANATLVVHDALTVDPSSATTAKVPATLPPSPAPAEPSPSMTAKPHPAQVVARPAPARSESAPSEITDEPSDGVIRQHIITAETAPVKRRRLPSDPPGDDDRPGDANGEIMMPHDQPAVEPRRSEPSILIADLAAAQATVSGFTSDLATAPVTVNAASRSSEAEVAATRSDAVAFSEMEEAFFRAGHDKDKEAVVAPQPLPESFDDLDVGYRPLGFWDRLRGKAPPHPDKK